MVESEDLDVSLTHKPFRNPRWKPPAKRNRTSRQILIDEARTRTKYDPDAPTWSSIEAPPSLQNPKKYCDVTGLQAHYTDPKSRLRYHNKEVYAVIRHLSQGVDQDYLQLRGAAVALR